MVNSLSTVDATKYELIMGLSYIYYLLEIDITIKIRQLLLP